MEEVPTYCYQCYQGPDLIKVQVEDGEVVGIEPNLEAANVHPNAGKCCVKAYSLVDKHNNPNRIKTPLLRQNPEKGQNVDPEWKKISWNEAINILAEKLNGIREEKGMVDKNGYPNLALTLGQAGVPQGHYSILPSFLSAWPGPIDLTLGTGQGTKCYHSEHVYAEYWHRAFMASADLPKTKLVLSFGHNANNSDGVGVWRRAESKEKGTKTVSAEPHLGITSAKAERWIPIRPQTDAIFLYSMINVILHEMDWKEVCDIVFLKNRTNSPYLVGPNGYYLRDRLTNKPLVWDPEVEEAKTYDDPSIKDQALTGEYKIEGVEKGPDDEIWDHEEAKCKPSFQKLIEHIEDYEPSKSEEICGVPQGTIREITEEFVENAHVGDAIEVNGKKLPYRPVAIEAGKSVNNGPGGYQFTWARAVLQTLVGGLEVPGGIIGSVMRLNMPYYDRWKSVVPGPDGFMYQSLNPTKKENWPPEVVNRGPYIALNPLQGHSGWASGIAPFSLAWLFQKNSPEKWPEPSPPEVWMCYRANPVRTMWNMDLIEEAVRDFPFTVTFPYIMDETSHYADLLLPDHTDLEGLQLRMIAPKHWLQFWEYYGFALKQPVVEPKHNTIDLADFFYELSDRIGILERLNNAINRGVGGGEVALSGDNYDFSLDLDKKYSPEELWDRKCRAATSILSKGEEEFGLEWFKQNGYYLVDYPAERRYLYPVIKTWGLRFELPFQERPQRKGKELKNRMHERDMHWWDKQLEEYQALPDAKDFTQVWEDYYRKIGEDPEEYDAWAVSQKKMQYAGTRHNADPIMAEAAKTDLDMGGVVMNSSLAEEKGIEDGDKIVVSSPFGEEEAVASVREGIRPDCVLMSSIFADWSTPAPENRKFEIPNVSDFTGLQLDTLDAGGSGCDLALVKIERLEES